MFSTAPHPTGFLSASNMSEESDISPEISSEPTPAATPRVRRVSTPRPKKKVAKSVPAESKEEEPLVEIVVAAVAPEPAPETEEAEEPAEVTATADTEWPEPEAATMGGASAPGEGGKRKRRRRKGKGGQSGNAPNGGPAGVSEENPVAASPEPKSEGFQEQRPRPIPNPQPSQQPAPQRPRVDPEHLAKMAWKIYLAEVSEEGVALIGDNDAKDLSRRCFRLAEIFIEEQARRR